MKSEPMKRGIPVMRGKTYEMEIHSLGSSWEGVGRYEDFTVFVPGALPGENVEILVEEVKKNYANVATDALIAQLQKLNEEERK